MSLIEYNPITYSVSIKLGNSSYAKKMEKLLSESIKCTRHVMYHHIYFSGRMYRRGKHRCLRCGAKLQGGNP